MGRAFRVVKRTAHLTVEVTERPATVSAGSGGGPARRRGAKPKAVKARGRAPKNQGAQSAAANG
jgi:hypothetical protein